MAQELQGMSCRAEMITRVKLDRTSTTKKLAAEQLERRIKDLGEKNVSF